MAAARRDLAVDQEVHGVHLVEHQRRGAGDDGRTARACGPQPGRHGRLVRVERRGGFGGERYLLVGEQRPRQTYARAGHRQAAALGGDVRVETVGETERDVVRRRRAHRPGDRLLVVLPAAGNQLAQGAREQVRGLVVRDQDPLAHLRQGDLVEPYAPT